MRRLFVAVLLAISTAASAAPRATTPEECAAFADMALVASAFARQKVDKVATFTAMTEIYSGGMDNERVVKTMSLIVSAAYNKTTAVPVDFAGDLLTTCQVTGGNMDSMLGVDS